MPTRTHEIFAALADATRLRVLLAVLDHGEVRPQRLQAELDLPQSTVSRALTQLRAAGLVARGGQRTPFRVPNPRETRLLLRSAAQIEHADGGNPEAAALAERLRRQDMARGADDDRAVASASHGTRELAASHAPLGAPNEP